MVSRYEVVGTEGEWDSRKEAYIEAIHQGMSLDYAPMESFVRQALDINQWQAPRL